MIGHDRIELNKRFVDVFNKLEEKGAIVKNDRNGRGMGDFAERILGNRAYGHIICAFLNPEDKRCFDYKHIDKLCAAYGVNPEYMMHGTGKPFEALARRASSEATPAMAIKGNILYTSVQALAGSGVEAGSQAPEDTSFFSIPDMPGSDLVAFSIDGNSMYPLIKYGDIVICEPTSSLEAVRDNDIYAIKTKDAVWVKYVQKIKNNRGRIVQLKLISENKLEYDPFVEDMTEDIRIYKVVRLICRL
jgi:hypothetical protein